MTRIAILDDYLEVVLQSADWSQLPDSCEVEVFNEAFKGEDRAAKALAQFDVLVVTRERTPFPASLLKRLPNLKLLTTTGMNNRGIDLAACQAQGIVVCGTPSYNGSTLELTWALVLGLVKHIAVNDAEMRAGGWQARMGESLWGKTLGVIGLGKIGSGSAALGKIFGMKVIAWSPNLTKERCAVQGVELSDKIGLFKNADVIVVHLVLSDKTRHLIGAAELAAMKPTAYLVNTSRGPLIDEQALIETLKSGRIAGAGLDVYSEEPLPKKHPIRNLKNALLSGHMGYNTAENARMCYAGCVENIMAWLGGKPIRVLGGKK